MTYVPVTSPEVDAKSPLDDLLFGKIQEDLDDLNSRIVLTGASPFLLSVNGKLANICNRRRSVDAGIVQEAFTPSRARYMLKKSGTAPFGDLSFDIRAHTSPRTPILSILPQYSGLTQSVARVGGTGMAAQSVARAATQIATQSITFAEATNAVLGVTLLGTTSLGTNIVQVTLTNPLSSNVLNGDSLLFASLTNAGNNGTFVLIAKNQGGGNNAIISNASAVAQSGAPVGTCQTQIMSYNFTNPVNAFFTAAFTHTFASHTSGANNGQFAIRSINTGGNNIFVANASGVTQGGAAGTVDTCVWKFALASAASTTDYVVGEGINTDSFTTGGNSQTSLPILLVNSGGNNIYAYNAAGAIQAGVAGNVKTNRWIYALDSDPSTNVSVGYGIYFTSHTSPFNNGYYICKDVFRTGANNVTVYNEGGVAQAGVAGNTVTTRKVVTFSADASASYTAGTSYVELDGCADSLYNPYWAYAPIPVVQVNRGGGANFNIVVDVTGNIVAASSQPAGGGYVQTEMKSLFTSPPIILAADQSGVEPNRNINGSTTAMATNAIAANTPLMLYLTSTPNNTAEDFSVVIR